MDKILVESSSVKAFSHGQGGHVTASLLCKTPDDAQKLVEAINALVTLEEKPVPVVS